jgi:long-chain acyl-CoA synthetase
MADRFAMRQEVHYDGRVLRCYAARPAHVVDMVDRAAARQPDAIALRLDDAAVSYAELVLRSGRVAGNLAAAGVQPGERVAVALGNRLEFAYAVLGCARLGAISVPLNTRMRRPELAFALNQCAAAVLIHEASIAAEVPSPAEAPSLRRVYVCGGSAAGALPFEQLTAAGDQRRAQPIGETDICHLLYTSGTTGRPKGAMLTHLGIVHSCMHFEQRAGLRNGDVTMFAVPASHVTGLVAVLYSLLAVGGTVVMMREFKARAFLELAARTRCNYTILVPAMYNLLLLDPAFDRFDLSAWRVGAYGGAPMPEATITALAKRLPNLILGNGYGATETTSPQVMMPLGATPGHEDSIGTLLDCCDSKVVDDEGHEVAVGEVGELWHAGPNVVPGYWDNPAANAENFAGGYWKSGDLGSIDAEGFVRLYDRKKDMINRAGFKVYSAEVENVLAYHPDVVECAIVGRPDPVLGERVQAFVVAKHGGLGAESIRDFLGERLSDYKVPDRVTFLREPLPRNPNGKVVKGELRKLVAAELAEEAK